MSQAHLGTRLGRILALSLILGLSGCSQPSEESATPSTEPEPAASETTAEEPQFSDGFESSSTEEWSKKTEPETEQSGQEGSSEEP